MLHNLVNWAARSPAGHPCPGGWSSSATSCSLTHRCGSWRVTPRVVLRLGLTPGSYPRGGRVHLRLWTAERTVAAFGVPSLARHPLGRAVRTRAGLHHRADVALHTTMPVTGLAELGDGCASSRRPTSPAGGWTATRCTSARCAWGRGPGGPSQHAAARGALGRAPNSRPAPAWPGDPRRRGWTGSPPNARASPTTVARAHPPRSRRWAIAYAVSLFGCGWLPLLAAVPGLVLLGWAVHARTRPRGTAWHVLAWPRPPRWSSVAVYASLLALVVRLLARAITPGYHASTAAWPGGPGWSTRSLDGARGALFPLYAGLAHAVLAAAARRNGRQARRDLHGPRCRR